jgi:hypothetical protein
VNIAILICVLAILMLEIRAAWVRSGWIPWWPREMYEQLDRIESDTKNLRYTKWPAQFGKKQ